MVVHLARTDPRAILHLNQVRDEAFGKTWLKMTAEPSDPSIGPLNGIIPMLNSATGIVLELGPGSGEQVRFLTNPEVKAIYGAEPCELLHETLRGKTAKAGISEKYHILDCGGQKSSLYPALERAGLLKAKREPVFDTIVCSKVLCSVPDMPGTVAGLYDLLKPGGRILVVEHVKNPWRTSKGSLFARLIQAVMMFIGWTFLLGGCCLDRDTLSILRDAAKKDGGWEKDNLECLVSWGTLPWAFGELQKKSK